MPTTQQLIDALNAQNYSSFTTLVNSYTATQATAVSQSDRFQVVSRLVVNFDLAGAQDAVVSSAIRTYMAKFGATTQIATVESSIVQLSHSIMSKGTYDYSALDAMTDYFTSAQRNAISATNVGFVVHNICQDLIRALPWGSASSIDPATAALRDFAAKFTTQVRAANVEGDLRDLAAAIDMSNSGDYRSIDAITDNMSATERNLIGDLTASSVVNAIAHDFAEALQWGNQSIATATSAALRDFATKFAAKMRPELVETALVQIAQAMDTGNSTDNRALDAITDNLNTSGGVQLSVQARLAVITALTNNALEGKAWSNTAFVEGSDAALRDWMSKTAGNTSVEAMLAPFKMVVNAKALSTIDAFIDHLPNTTLGSLKQQAAAELAAAKILIGSTATETITGTAAAEAIFSHMGNDTVNAGAGNDTVYAGTGADIVYGQDGADVLYGEVGFDKLYGGLGNDKLYAGDETAINGNFLYENWLYGEGGNDILTGGSGRDLLDGGDGADTLLGGANNDVLTGGAGNDIINGGAATDTVTGGAGIDTFVFDNFDVDLVTDYDSLVDKLDISALLTVDFDPLTMSIYDFVSIGANTTGSMELRVDADGVGNNHALVANLGPNAQLYTDLETMVAQGLIIV